VDKNLYEMPSEELKQIPSAPDSLKGAVEALEADHDFLLKGDVFSPQLIERWITYKRDREITPLRMRPHPLEFSLYYDI
jgi:glutamine synthetase